MAARAISIFDSLNTMASSQVLYTSVFSFNAAFLTNLEKLANPNNSFNWIKAARRVPSCPQQPDKFSCGFMVYIMLEARFKSLPFSNISPNGIIHMKRKLIFNICKANTSLFYEPISRNIDENFI